jgi:hypothetical protein
VGIDARLRFATVATLALVILPRTTAFPTAADPATKSDVSGGKAPVDGVPLTPITSGQRGQCEKYADQLDRPVMCPGLFPTPIPPSVAPPGGCDRGLGEDQCGPAIFQISKQTFSKTKQMLINQSNFQVPPGYVGVPNVPSISGGPLGHFVFVEGPTVSFVEGVSSGRKLRSVSIPSSCHVFPLTTPTRIHRAVPQFYECADGPMTPDTPALYLGHDLLTWRERGLLMEVSFHGHTSVNQDLAVAVAKATILVSPRRH